MKNEKQKEIQEKVLLYQILQNQLEEFGKQGVALENRLNELETTTNALGEIKKVGKEPDTLVPLGGGCFSHGKITEKDKFIVEVGAGIMIEKSLPEALAVIEERKEEVENVKTKLQEEMQKLSNSMNQITIELQKSAGKAGESDGDDIAVD